MNEEIDGDRILVSTGEIEKQSIGAYTGFCEATQRTVVPWDDLPPHIRQAWRNVVVQIRNKMPAPPAEENSHHG